MTDTEDTNESIEPRERSVIAEEIARLKEATFRAVAERERLPQPLFWSVFGEQLKSIKRLKAQTRAIEAVINEKV